MIGPSILPPLLPLRTWDSLLAPFFSHSFLFYCFDLEVREGDVCVMAFPRNREGEKEEEEEEGKENDGPDANL